MNDYVKEMRKIIGAAPLQCVSCGVLIENDRHELLLQKRTDDGTWGTPGGGMNFGETFYQNAAREVYEETGLRVSNLALFGIYSGKYSTVTYPNGDNSFGAIIMFHTTDYEGTLQCHDDESEAHTFFARDALPENLHHICAKWIHQWKEGQMGVHVE